MNVAAAALEGALDDFSISSLLDFLARARQSGTLTVSTASPSVVCFDEGAITLGGPADPDQMKVALVSAGVLRPGSWERAHLSASGHGLALADELVRSGATTRATLLDAVYESTVNTVFELLLPSSASFSFAAVVDHPLGHGQRFDSGTVVTDAQRRLRMWKQIAEVIPATSVVVRLVDQLPINTELITFSREEWPVLTALDGRRDVEAVITHTGLSAFGVCGVLHRFLTSGIATSAP